MAAEVVSVPTRGIERWLTQRLSAHLGATPGRQDGVCANIDFPFPGTVVNGALAVAAGTDPDADPWLPQRAVWPLLEVVETHFDEPWLAPLAQHIRNSETVQDSKRFSSIRHVADLFDRYARAPTRNAAALGRRLGRRGRGRAGRWSCGGCCGPGSGSRARPSAWSTPAGGCGTSPSFSTSRPGCPCSG